MINLNYFLIIYIATIAVTRIVLWLWPRHSPTIGNFRTHHYMWGVLLLLLCLIVRQPILFAIGAALIIDELPLFLIFEEWNWPVNHWKEYNSWQNILGIVILSALLFVYLAI